MLRTALFVVGVSFLGSVAAAQDPAPQQVQAPLRVGGAIKAPAKVVDVAPVYPDIAISARKTGVVILELLLGTDGAVQGSRVIRSVPLLDEAARDATMQWRYTPTLLNGVPVQLFFNVTVTFELQVAADGSVVPATARGYRRQSDVAPISQAPPAPSPAPAAAPVASPAAADSQPPVRVGGVIGAPRKIYDVPPDYPLIAQQAAVEGTVILELLVDPNGLVADAKVIRSIPLLDQAALEAVRQWIYTPTLLNGVPTSIFYNVTVTFSLSR